jgi:hypothetical protein
MSARDPAAYERFVEAMKAILSVAKTDVEKDMRTLRRKRRRSRGQRKTR